MKKKIELYNEIKKVEIVLLLENDTIIKIVNNSNYRIPFKINDKINIDFIEIWSLSRDFYINEEKM